MKSTAALTLYFGAPAARAGGGILARRVLFARVSAVACGLMLVTTAQAGPFDVETKLTASDAMSGDWFGFSVGIDGNTAVVGALFDDNEVSSTGSAYLFDVTSGDPLFKLIADDAAEGDQFGHSVAISGNTAIVGARNDDDGGSGSGSAYLFDVTTGTQLFKLTAADAAAGDGFGASVGVSGNTAIVGSTSESAYLFDVTTGNQLFKLTSSGAAASVFFGWSVGISGNTAIVGAYGSSGGSAYLFDVATGNELRKLTASDARLGQAFGFSVGISGNTAIVGALHDDDGGAASGSAYLFDVTTGTQLAKLTASDAARFDNFGNSVAISGNTAIVGSRMDEDAGANSGSAYLFDVTTGKQIVKLTANDADGFDNFGISVGISEHTAIVGANGGGTAGSAYLYTPEPSSLLLAGLACVGLIAWRKDRGMLPVCR
jgi:WD40 repeat protein